jgi:hypothetical protein
MLFSLKGLIFTDEELDRRRIHRALALLCQAASVSIDTLPGDVRTDRLNMKNLQRQPLKRPTLSTKTSSLGNSNNRDASVGSEKLESEDDMAVSSKYPDSGIKGNFVMTQTSYETLGAKLKTSQLRPPIANRIDGTRISFISSNCTS